MIKRISGITIFFYFLSLLQTGFMASFPAIINILAISVGALAFFEEPKKYYSIIGAITGGFFWDIFSTSFFGFHILVLLIITALIKVFAQYVRIPLAKRITR